MVPAVAGAVLLFGAAQHGQRSLRSQVSTGDDDRIQKRHPQLERAVKEALRLLELNPVRRVPRPAPIDQVSKGKER